MCFTLVSKLILIYPVMNKNLLKTSVIILVTGLLNIQFAFAQAGTNDILKSGLTDANKMMDAYASPLLKSFGAGLNSGWFNTAKPHGIGGFDITFTGNITFAPTSDQSFDPNSLGLQNVKIVPGQINSTTPTIFGSSDTSKCMNMGLYARYPGATQDSLMTKFQLPAGFGYNIFAVPALQAAVGVGFGTEVAVRFFPNLSFNGINVGLYGFAIKHDFKQWIPVMKSLPFDLSAMFGYTSLSASYKFADANQIQGAQPSNDTYNANPSKVYNDQQISFASNAWTANVIISKKLLFFTPYLGVGYQYANTTLTMAGTFPLVTINPNFDYTKVFVAGPGGTNINPNYHASDPNSHPKIVQEYKDPVQVSGVLSGFKATVGFRIHLPLFTLHADYTFANYNVASIGAGINIQSIVPFHLW